MIRLSDEQMKAIQEAAQRCVEILIGQRFAFALSEWEEKAKGEEGEEVEETEGEGGRGS